MAKDKTKADLAERQSENRIDPRRAATSEPAEVTPAKPDEMRLVEEHAYAQGLPAWELAALRQATGWAPGKTVSAEQFGQAVELLRRRRLGGGRIARNKGR